MYKELIADLAAKARRSKKNARWIAKDVEKINGCYSFQSFKENGSKFREQEMRDKAYSADFYSFISLSAIAEINEHVMWNLCDFIELDSSPSDILSWVTVSHKAHEENKEYFCDKIRTLSYQRAIDFDNCSFLCLEQLLTEYGDDQDVVEAVNGYIHAAERELCLWGIMDKIVPKEIK